MRLRADKPRPPTRGGRYLKGVSDTCKTCGSADIISQAPPHPTHTLSRGQCSPQSRASGQKLGRYLVSVGGIQCRAVPGGSKRHHANSSKPQGLESINQPSPKHSNIIRVEPSDHTRTTELRPCRALVRGPVGPARCRWRHQSRITPLHHHRACRPPLPPPPSGYLQVAAFKALRTARTDAASMHALSIYTAAVQPARHLVSSLPWQAGTATWTRPP